MSIYIALYSMVALGLVLLTGVAGLISFGQAAFVGIGAYAAAWLATQTALPPLATLAVGVALAVLTALVLGLLTLRMSGHYLPLATICWGLALNFTMANMEGLGKYDGILGIPSMRLFAVDLGTGRGLHPLAWAIALLAALAVLRLLDSRPGRAIRSLKSGATMAEAMGISTFRYSLPPPADAAAVLAAVSGWLAAHFQRSVSPSPFGITDRVPVHRGARRHRHGRSSSARPCGWTKTSRAALLPCCWYQWSRRSVPSLVALLKPRLRGQEGSAAGASPPRARSTGPAPIRCRGARSRPRASACRTWAAVRSSAGWWR